MRTPLVHKQRLWLPEPALPIRLATAAWWRWLQQATLFRYLPPQSIYAFTVRKEKRRHDWYWYAYLKSDAKLHNAYVGRSQDLTLERLHLVCEQLTQKVRQAQRAARTKGGDAPH